MSKPNTPSYKTLNCPEYNKALRRRRSLTIRWPAGDCLQSPKGWFDPDMAWAAQPTGKRVRQACFA